MTDKSHHLWHWVISFLVVAIFLASQIIPFDVMSVAAEELDIATEPAPTEPDSTVPSTEPDGTSPPSAEDFPQDTTPPVITDLTRSSNTWEKKVIYTFQTDDTQSGIANISVFLDGESVELNKRGSNTYEFQVMANGAYIVTAVDNCGNETTLLIEETQIDDIPPTIEQIITQSSWDPSSNTAEAIVTDNAQLSSVVFATEKGSVISDVVVTEDGHYQVTLPRNGNYLVIATDIVGNQTQTLFVIDHIDTAAPSKPLIQIDTEQWTNQDLTVTATATDSHSGVAAFYYSTTGSDFIGYPEEWTRMNGEGETGSATFTNNQEQLYYVVAVDHVGRVSQLASFTVRIDKTAPESVVGTYCLTREQGYILTLNENTAVFKDTFSVDVIGSDNASGLVKIAYLLETADGFSSGWIESNVSNGKLHISYRKDIPEGHYTVWVKACDKAGNWTEPITPIVEDSPGTHILEFTDTSDTKAEAPTLTILEGANVYDNRWTNQTVTISVSGSGFISGIQCYQYRINYTDPALEDTAWTTLSPDIYGRLGFTIDQDTNASYSFRAVSYAGNVSGESSSHIMVQKTAPSAAVIFVEEATGRNGWHTKIPEVYASTSGSNPYTAPVSYTFNYYLKSTETVVSKTVYSLYDCPDIPNDGYWKAEVITRDEAGNYGGTTQVEFKIDNTPPNALSVIMDSFDITNSSEAIPKWNDEVTVANCVRYTTDYELFRSEPVVIRAYAKGGLSGNVSLYYQITSSNTAYKQHGEWTPLNGSITLDPNGIYCLFFKAVDGAGNTTYFSGSTVILDSMAPAGSEENPEVIITPLSANSHSRGCYNGDVTIAVTIIDPSTAESSKAYSGISYATYRVFTDGKVTETGVLFNGDPDNRGVAKSDGNRVKQWTGQMIVNAEINNSNDIIIEITAHDNAGNVKVSYSTEGAIKIDLDKPIVEASYDNNSPITEFEGKSAFNSARTLIVSITERNFDIYASHIRIVDTDSYVTTKYEWIQDENGSYAAVIPIDRDGHYSVEISVTDAAGNTQTNVIFAPETVGATQFIIDTVAPSISVSYDNNTPRNEFYFHTGRTLSIRIYERNFDPSKIAAQLKVVLEGGAISTLYLSGWSSYGITHELSYVCYDDGIYDFGISGTDALGNAASVVQYLGVAPNHFIVDTHIDDPIFVGVEEGAAYSGDVIPEIIILDANLDYALLSLVVTRDGGSKEDLTPSLLSTVELTDVEGGQTALLDIFEKIQTRDGVYTLTAYASDLAGNIVQKTIHFSVNRFGSVYTFDRITRSIRDVSMKYITDDVVITEFNPSVILDGSQRVFITRDGMPVSNPIYEVIRVSKPEEEGITKWSQYKYVISKENFTEDGIYEVVISTADAAGNYPENTSADYKLTFAIDTTPPELSAVTGLEEAIYKGTYLRVELTVTDNVSVESILVYVNNTLQAEWQELSGFTVIEEFGLMEGMDQQIRIILEDAAGNKMDTKSESFQPGYEFNAVVTVSGNFFLRFYANKPLYYTFMIGMIIAGIIWIVILILEERRETALEEAEFAAESLRKAGVHTAGHPPDAPTDT